MNLRNKVTAILLILWLVMVTISYVGSHLILSKSYEELEHQQALDNLQRVDEAINQMTSSVNTATSTWAVWDDAYRFVQGKNKQFRAINFVVSSFVAADIDVMMYYNSDGKLVDKMGVNANRTVEAAIPRKLLDSLAPDGRLKYQPKVGNHLTGLIAVGPTVYMIAIDPIVKSNGDGPAAGSIIMARLLTKSGIEKLSNITKLDIDIQYLANKKMDSDMRAAYEKLSQGDVVVIHEDNERLLSGYRFIRDINHEPIGIIKMSMPRSIYNFGMRVVKYYNVTFFVYSLIVLGVLWYLLQILLVKRLEALRNHIGNSDNSNYFNSLLSRHSDEISSVASLYHQATHDSLTGLANRNLLDRTFKKYVKTVDKNHSKIAMLFLDVDYFKRINDSLGHEIGDLLLIEIARKLTSCLRENDLAVRLGGDEFVVMLVDIDVEKISFVIERIYQAFTQSIQIKDHELYVASSMGVSIYPNDGNNISTLLKNADIALYHAKERGRNHYQYYSDQLNEELHEAHRKEAELQRAIDNKELSLVYQPVFNVLTREIISFETLIRWNHPVRGILTGSEIIPIAEKSGLIHPIGKWVLANACRQIKVWQNKGLSVVPVAVNISVMQTRNTSIYRMVCDVLQHTGLDPKYLQLELTETSYIEINDSISHDMRMLKTIGVDLIVDDFGVGYSGLSYLRRLPISQLKIDQSFIKDSCNNPDDCAITLAIIAIAHQLDLHVIAEGVETLQQYEFLRNNHVDAAQGHYLSPPLDATECEEILASKQIRVID